MSYVLSESIGNYRHSINITDGDKPNTLIIFRGQTVLFCGEAKSIEDSRNRITFTDMEDVKHEIIKFNCVTTA